MTVYTGFTSGQYQAWALDLNQNVLGQPGIARAMNVTPNSPAGMSVLVTADAVNGDGVCYVPNGSWLRIDATTTLSVPNNTSGATRTDAVVATVDPSLATASGLTYVTNWTTGLRGNNTTQFVLALVFVPNNATSVIASDILQSPLFATSGPAPQSLSDSLIGAERVDGGEPHGIFVSLEVTLSTAATNGQTSFNVPLTPLQALVPQGRIGGALEHGFFSGPNGWYYPKLRGSVSGLLPVASVDAVNGNILSALGAQAGEVVTASYKYYDFSRDARVRGGQQWLERTSPYLVYQGEALEDTIYGTQYPLWEGSQNGSLLLNPGESIVYSDYVNIPIFGFLVGPGGATITTTCDGASSGTFVFSTPAGYPGGTYTTQTRELFPASGGFAPHTFTITLTAGTLGVSGVRAAYSGTNFATISGGLISVQGNPVFLQSTSFALPSPTGGYHSTYVIYTDANGNLSSGAVFAAGMDRVLGRAPVAGMIQYGGQGPTGVTSTNTSSLFGFWGLPGAYLGMPVTTVLTGNTTASNTSGMGHGWTFVRDALSPVGGYVVSNTSGDVMLLGAVCTGLDALVLTTTKTAPVVVTVDNVTTYTLALGGTSARNVRVTLASNWPYGSHVVKLNVNTASTLLGIESVDVRVPATPSAPSGTVPLAQVVVFGMSSLLRPSLIRGGSVGAANTSTVFLMDGFGNTAEPSLWMGNTAVAQDFVLQQESTGGARLHLREGPAQGILQWTVGGATGSTDTYSATYLPDVPVLVGGAANIASVSFTGTNAKNASSTNTQVVVNGVEVWPWPLAVTDMRHFPVNGVAPNVHGAAVDGPGGQRYEDGGHGIRAGQLRDRAVTSRKMAPTYARVASSASQANMPAFDSSLVATVATEVPSNLLINAALAITIPGSSGASVTIYVDGAPYGFTEGTSVGPSGLVSTLTVSDLVPVPAGLHQVQLFVQAAGGGVAQPAIGAGANRTLSVVAFAL